MVRNAAVEAENNIRAIKAAVQPASGSRQTKIFVGMLGGKPSTQMAGLVSSFKSEESNTMVAEEMEAYALSSVKMDYEDPGKQAPMGFMEAGGGVHDEMLLTGGIKNPSHFPAIISHRIPTGRQPLCT